MNQTIERARPIADLSAVAAQLAATAAEVAEVIELLRTRDETEALANATSFLFAFGHLVMGWIWLDIAITASERCDRHLPGNDDLAQGKVVACKYFFAYEMPRISAWLACIHQRDGLLEVSPAVL